MANWQDLASELERWALAGRRATFWWRDDDAVEPNAALTRLLALARARDLPLALAVIPARLSQRLVPALAGSGATVTLLQHGYAHRNHAPQGEKKQELGDHRPLTRVLHELARGAAMLDAGLGSDPSAEGGGPERAAVLVPPWNRFAAGLLPALPGLGFDGLSGFGPRAAEATPKGLRLCHCHVDILRWKDPRGFRGEAETLAQLIAHLGARRRGEADGEEATGLMTHHLAHDGPAWAFLERLLDTLTAHPAVDFLSVSEAFGWTQRRAPQLAAAGR